ncbi:sporulation protein YqfC [Clostridium algidicarnis]|uniref:Sporulation protein YqfC n=2 Tax=Clostridium algidicarnis TaxID=37659 RepID=A0A2S6G0V0_9CLOT|nr:sporulation protein YqfC [Clostridium algidicarnis]MBB6630503.1 sporulation protein YqfC [Clostridium algidicarnis]MBB6696360.1 sporulation protein YqfC [Clostridium algidicarnis]MBU3193579.1 sporulation protein YqfC [Clostridium algidicarnis]MBU3195778.1 sporulation protein YqfC [Clostridium algidicarnis]MBU3203015.1 sporulation protein YqfC [Clostridium algidicarnis]
MDNKIDIIKEGLSEKLELPREIILDLPMITITGNRDINIENHKGIIIFDEDKVKINSKIGAITIYGSDFEVLFLGGKTFSLKGTFKSVVYEGNE